MNRDGKLMWESYSLLNELQNSKRTRQMFVKKYETGEFSISDKQAGHYIEDFMSIYDKLPKDSIGPKEGNPRDLFGPYYRHLDLVTSTIQRYEGETGKTRKKERLIEWARAHDDVIVDNEYGIAVKINNHEESHLFGQVTKWCTTTACRKNWNRYQKQGVNFIYIVDLNSEASSKAITSGPHSEGENVDYYALALYDMTWEDLYATNPEVAKLPHDDEFAEYMPMAAAYPHLGGDVDEWVQIIQDRLDSEDYDSHDDVDYIYEVAAEVEKEFAQDFMQRWDQVTGGLPAMEAFDDKDESVSPIAVSEHFALPFMNIKSFKPKPIEDRMQRMLDTANTFEQSYRLWSQQYIVRYDERRPDARYNPERGMRQTMLHKRWPEMERKWLGWMNDVWKKARVENGFYRPEHAAYVNGPTYKTFQLQIIPYIKKAFDTNWVGLETYFGHLRETAVHNFFKLGYYIKGGSHDYPEPADLKLTWTNKNSAFYGQPNFSELADKISAASSFVNVYSDIYPFIELYFKENGAQDPDMGGTVWTPSDSARRDWEVHELRMKELIQLTDDLTDKFIMNDDFSSTAPPGKDPTTGLDYDYRKSIGLSTPEAESIARDLVHKLPQFRRLRKNYDSKRVTGERWRF